MKEKGLIIFLVAVIFVLAAMVFFNGRNSIEPAFAGSGGGAGSIIAVIGQINNGQKEVLYVVDTERKTVAVYDYNGSNAINLKTVRHFAKDIQMVEYPGNRQKPSVSDINKFLKKEKKSNK